MNSEIKDDIIKYFGCAVGEVITIMQKRKATNMFNFLAANPKALKKLKNNDLMKPIARAKKFIEGC